MLKNGDEGRVSIGKGLSKEVSQDSGPLRYMAGGVKDDGMYSGGCFD